MKLNPSITLIISTYNWPKALELVLISVKNQTVLPTEIIIADDGSGDETREVITKFKKKLPIPLIHIWHKDDGFRLSEIRNKAIQKAIGDYIIQIDGDVILHKHFIKDHLKIAKKNVFLVGSRVLMNERLTTKIQKTKIVDINWFSKGIKNRLNTIYFPFLTKFLISPTKNIQKVIENARGCNMSFWKQDLIAVNGYNQDMVEWGREDSEISVRLVNAGKIKERIKFGAIQYHQYHPLNSRKGLNKNDEILAQSTKQKISQCKNGLSKHF